jgi:hypothetical protein
MQDETQMTVAERRKYLSLMRGRYLLAARAEQNRLLGKMHALTGMHRKSLLRWLHTADLRPHPRIKQRGKTYGTTTMPLAHLAKLGLYRCERLTPALLPTARHLAQHGELLLTDALVAQLEQISIASVQRRLTRLSSDTPCLPRGWPEQANRVARDIPMPHDCLG